MMRGKKKKRRRKKTFLGFGRSWSTDLLTDFYHRNIWNISRPPFFYAIGSARNQKKSSQNKRTFQYLLQNNNCIGHTLRRVSGRKRRKRERNAHVFLSSSQREKESFFLSCHHRLSKKRFEQKWLFNFIPTVCWFCCWDSLKRRERVYESFSSWVHRKTTTETTTTRR